MVLKNDTINNMVLNRAAEGEEQIQGVHPILNEELLKLRSVKQMEWKKYFQLSQFLQSFHGKKEVTDVWMREFL